MIGFTGVRLDERLDTVKWPGTKEVLGRRVILAERLPYQPSITNRIRLLKVTHELLPYIPNALLSRKMRASASIFLDAAACNVAYSLKNHLISSFCSSLKYSLPF